MGNSNHNAQSAVRKGGTPVPGGSRLRIVAADDEPDMREFFQRMLAHLGHDVVGVAETGQQLVELARDNHPDLIITDVEMPGIDGLEALKQISAEHPVPGIVVSAHNEPEFIERAAKSTVLAYLVKPIKKEDLPPAIALAMQRFRELEALHAQTVSLKQALDDRKVIERAKGVIMKRAGLPEAEAFHRLQQLASERNCKMIEVAQTLLDAEQAFQ